MFEIRYSKDFYVNTFPNKGEEYARGHIEAFIEKMPRKLKEYLESQNHFGEIAPEFQAVIIGEPKISMFGKSQVAVVMIHSNFAAYTTAMDYQSPINRTYGYATFDNRLSVTRVMDHLEMRSAYETIVVGYGSESLDRDYEVVHKLLEKNTQAVESYYNQLETEEAAAERMPADESSKSLEEVAKEVELSDNKMIGEKPPVEEQSLIIPEEEWLTEADSEYYAPEADNEYEEEARLTLSDEEPPAEEELAAQVRTEEMTAEKPVKETNSNEEEESTPMHDESETNMEEIVENKPEEIKTDTERSIEEGYHFNIPEDNKEALVDTSKVDPRFSAETLIISNDSIPHGFVFREPVIYAYSVRPGIFKSSSPRKGYIKAYETCLDMIRDDIADGLFDAVFNLRFSAQSVDNYYEVIVTGDAVIYQKED